MRLHQPPDIRGLHLIAVGVALAVTLAISGLAGHLTTVGG